MKQVIASSRAVPYLLFATILLCLAGYTIITWGWSIPLALGVILLLWIIYQTIITREVVIALPEHLVYRHGLSYIQIPWDKITNISVQQHRLDMRYVVICFLPTPAHDSIDRRIVDMLTQVHHENELVNHLSLTRVAGDPDQLCEDLQRYWQGQMSA